MLFTKSAEYALRAMAHLASYPQGTLLMAKQIAKEAKLPSQFLAKLLQHLAQKGLLRSVKGPRGGFGLVPRAAQIRLADVLQSFDPGACERACPLGEPRCEAPGCQMHDGWEALHSLIIKYLEQTTLADISPLRPSRSPIPSAFSARSKGSR
ncbi:MAG: Rrf2 family transcriptional regulator [Bryobacteraceae bacterium]|nr:Rrf2 family transcriptional regulator [Bryobacteraceae bacterium]MDW8376882.1 Rrf2 family transcriptional regulator [Bryobacterales bacterium]